MSEAAASAPATTTTTTAPAAAPTTPPASATATPPATTTPGAGATVTDWTSGLSDDLKGFVTNKGFKDPAGALESYRNLEKLMGAPKERLLKLPENMEDAASMGEIYDRLGRPSKAEEYGISAPKEGGDPEFAKWAGGTFHELGLSKQQATALVTKWNEYVQNLQKGLSEKNVADNQAQADSLKKKWGAAYDQNIKVAKGAMREFGISLDVIDKMESAMGFSQVMELLHTVGSKLGEGAFVTGNSQQGFGVMTPEAARNRISALRQDSDFIKRYSAGDANAKAEMDRLHKMAYVD